MAPIGDVFFMFGLWGAVVALVVLLTPLREASRGDPELRVLVAFACGIVSFMIAFWALTWLIPGRDFLFTLNYSPGFVAGQEREQTSPHS
jgi:hypothetical protein